MRGALIGKAQAETDKACWRCRSDRSGRQEAGCHRLCGHALASSGDEAKNGNRQANQKRFCYKHTSGPSQILGGACACACL